MKFLRVFCVTVALPALTSCTGYDPSFYYKPGEAVHEVRSEQGNVPHRATVRAHLAGVLRRSDAPRRVLHARLDVENPSPEPLTLRASEMVAVSTDQSELKPESPLTDVELPPGNERSLDVFFPVAHLDEPLTTVLREVVLRWRLSWPGGDHTSESRFENVGRRYRHHDWPYHGHYHFHYGYPHFYYFHGYHSVWWHCD